MHITFNNSARFIYNIQKNSRIKKEKSIKKLGSGLKIVNASDDAAGLAISEKMRAQIRGLHQAKRNAQDFISLTQVIDSGLNEITESMQRMRELAIAALSDTYTDCDREMIQEEYQNLKKHIDDISNYTEFNTMNVYQQHMSTYEQFKGNKVLEDQLTVIKGVNDYLGISVDGEFKEVYLDPGTYSREEFLDMLDDKLWEVDGNLIPSIDRNNVLSLSAENYKKIDALIGGALGFFYEYHIGMGAGVVIGFSDLSGKLDIVKGSNDQFIFNIGDKRYTVNFEPTPGPRYMGNGYTAEEIVEIMQSQLDEQGANVKVYMNGNQIALDAGHHIIDGFAGNMIKIDGITSILYDNAKHGQVYRTSGYVQSRVPYNTPIEIKEDINDVIGFYLDGEERKYEIKLTAKLYNNLSEIADEINKQLEENNIEARAEIAYSTYPDIYKKLTIYSNTSGARSKVELDTESSAYEILFKHVQTTTPYIDVGKSIPAQIEGMSGLSDNIRIIEGVNDTLRLKVDGEEKVFKLNERTYTRQQLVNELNKQSEDINADIAFSVLHTRLIITHNQSGSQHSIEIDDRSNAYMTLLCERIHPDYISGKTIVTPPQEGSTQPTYEYTSGKVESRKYISELIINENNDTLSFNVSGEEVSIVLDYGIYNAETLREELQRKIDEKTDNVIVGINYGAYIFFETKRKGEGQGFSSLGGTAYNDIFTYIRKPYTNISYGYETYSYIRGVKSISSNVIIDENNKDLKFIYSEDGKKK